MGQLMMEKITNADMIIFNRCDEALRDSVSASGTCGWPTAGRTSTWKIEDNSFRGLPHRRRVPLRPDPGRHLNVAGRRLTACGMWTPWITRSATTAKLVHMKLVMCHSKKYPGVDCPGRFAMVCCAKDITFLGLHGPGTRIWTSTKTATGWRSPPVMGVEEHPAYQGRGAGDEHRLAMGPCEKPKDEVVGF
jgi:hypothetical protein